jgi:hypothetical protein
MASGHVNRTNRPNTWLHRPACGREESPCQPGAVHTWHIATCKFTSGFAGVRTRYERQPRQPRSSLGCLDGGMSHPEQRLANRW